MAQHELEAALQAEGEVEARQIWQRAEAEAAELRAETAQTLDLQRQAAANRRQVESAARHEALLSEARKRAQNCRLTAEDQMARRLKTLAETLLEDFALRGGAQLFQTLAEEIPDCHWQQIKVNPRDISAAEISFPTAEILADHGTSGGLEVQSADDRIRIINSLEKRLEHLWPELLPELFKEIRALAGDDESFT